MKGEGIFAYVVLKEKASAEISEIKNAVRSGIGPFATPDKVVLLRLGGLPKTRSGKIMRRILRKIAANDTGNLGDVSTLADPGVVDMIKDAVAAME